ncbi:MAG TPA: hypothetical protein VI168_16080 [Croceibacterium sp.]
MATLSAAASSAGQAQPTGSTIRLQGKCEYGERITPYADGSNGFAWCDSIVIVQDGQHATFDFLRESWGSMVRYEADPSSDPMVVMRVQVRNRPAEPAQGTCTIYRLEGRISTVTCIATARQLAWAANFVPRR